VRVERNRKDGWQEEGQMHQVANKYAIYSCSHAFRRQF